MCGSYAHIQLSRESGSQLVNMAGYELEVILPIFVLLTLGIMPQLNFLHSTNVGHSKFGYRTF